MADKFLNYTQLQAFLNKLKDMFATKSVATTSADGLMAAGDKTKLNGIASGATNVTSTTVSGWGYTKNTGTVTSVSVKMNNTTKGSVTTSGTIDLGTVLTAHQDISGKENSSNKVTSWSSTTTDAHYPSEKLVKSALDGKANSSHTHTKSQITDFPSLATVATSGNYNDLTNKPSIDNNNQKIKGNGTAYGDNATINIVPGSNVSIANDTTNNQITISATDTKYSNFVKSGASASAGLVPAPSTTAGTSKYLREDGTWQTPPNTTYGVATTSANGLMSSADKTKLNGIATGATANVGTITEIKMNGASKGTSGSVDLGTVLTSHQSLTAYAKLASPALTGTPTAPTANAGTNSTQIATTAFVNTAINNIPSPMVFKGTLGSGGTVTTLPTSGVRIGDTYKVITAGTYASKAAKVGDIFIATATTPTWELVPSGDEPSGTVTSVAVKMNGSVKGTVTTSGTIDLGTVLTSHQDISGKADKSSLATVATSGSYNDLSNKPTIDNNNQKIQGNGTSYGANATVNLVPGNNVSIANDTTNNKITISATDTKYSNFVKSGSGAAAGLVPAPSTTAGTSKYLREDGTWVVPPNTTYSDATTSAHGLMTAADKTKLNGIAAGATANTGTVKSVAVKMNGSTKGTITTSGTIDLGNVVTTQYSLPTASTSTLGGVKVDGTTITINNGVISSLGGISYEVIGTL